LHATTEPARIINNDAPAPVGNITDNNNDHEQLIDGDNVENVGNPANNNDAAPVGNVGNHTNNNDPPNVVNVGNPANNNDAAPVGNVDNHANNNDPPNVVDEQTNIAAGLIHNITDNNDQGINDDTAPVRNTANSRDNNEQLNDAVNNDRCEVADGQLIEAVVGNGTTFTINYLNNQLEIGDERIKELEAKLMIWSRR